MREVQGTFFFLWEGSGYLFLLVGGSGYHDSSCGRFRVLSKEITIFNIKPCSQEAAFRKENILWRAGVIHPPAAARRALARAQGDSAWLLRAAVQRAQGDSPRLLLQGAR